MIAIVSVSGGKDSTATLLLALERLPKESILPAFADTGHEHPAVYEYLAYLEDSTGMKIKRLRAEFSAMWWQRRDYIRDHWQRKMELGSPATDKSDAVLPIPAAEAAVIVARALAVFEAGPTGNPFLDICIIKYRFPSRLAQFCTQFLKRHPLDAYAVDMVAAHGDVESWQGVRADESESRAKLAERETDGNPWTIVRPILKWTIADVFAMHRKHGIKPNPLYSQGMNRVGCMPCINTSKDELWNVSERFPDHIARVLEWERLVSDASKRGQATFFHAIDPIATPDVRSFVEWSKTERGGTQFDLLKAAGVAPGCASSYGLCDIGDEEA